MKTHKKAAVYFSAGIGDALLLTPLIKRLKLDGYLVTGIFTSPYNVEGLYKTIDILNDIIVVKNKVEILKFVINKINSKYDISFINFFAANKTNLYMAAITSKQVVTNKKTKHLIYANRKIRYIKPLNDLHEGVQHLRLYIENPTVNEADFLVNLKNTTASIFIENKINIALQFGTGNNKTPYKSWDSDRWECLMNRISIDFPNINFILLGDYNETLLYKNYETERILNLCGKTTLNDLPFILKNCSCFIGGDSGLMHLSAALSIPTFTIWGGSDEIMFNYHIFNPAKHEYIFNTSIKCRPCNSWINPNISRVTNPLLCPDFICLKNLSVEQVYEKLYVFLKKQLLDDKKNI